MASANRNLTHGEVAVLRALAKLVKTGGIDKPPEKAAAVVRRIAANMNGHPRKEIIEACVAAGVNPATAKTQYQKWFAAHHPHH